MQSLKEIAKGTGTKKQFLNIFIERYEQLFSKIRDKHITILEIGIGGYKDPKKGGGSLLMWSKYFPNATIVGLDINEKQLNLPSRITVHQGCQTDTVLLNEITENNNGFDVVIDDGSHITDKTIKSFDFLWENTRSLYIIEDLHMAKAHGTREYFQKISGSDFETHNMCVVSK